MEGFDAKRLAVLQETFAGVGDEFVQRDHPAVAVDVHQEALEALVAIGKGDQQESRLSCSRRRLAWISTGALSTFGGCGPASSTNGLGTFNALLGHECLNDSTVP